jgi:glucose-fructose oxidoreductase
MRKDGRTRKSPRYAVVGLGHIAQVAVLPAFTGLANSRLTAIVSDDEEKLEKLRKKYRVAHVASYADYEQVLSEVDAVYIALPNHLHREYAVRAAQAGVHILCEKPMAVTVEDCEAMIDAAAVFGVKLMIAYRLHFEKGNLEAIRIASSGKLGSLRIFDSVFAQQVVEDNVRVSRSVEEGGGPVYDMGVYCINAARYLFQSEPVAVSAISANNGEKRFKKTDEMSSAILHFPQERLATFTCSFGGADIGRYTLVGTKGTLTADPAYEYASGTKLQLSTAGGKRNTRRFPKRDQFAAEIEYFSDCILRDYDPEPSGLEGLADVRVVRALYESAKLGERVELPDLPSKKRPRVRQEIHKPPHGKPQTVKTQSPSGDAA